MRLLRRYGLVAALSACGLGLTIWLGALQGADVQPTRATSALLVVLAGGFQVAAAVVASQSGKAHPGLARASVRRLYGLTARVRAARLLAEREFDKGDASTRRLAMGRISVDLSWIEEGLVESISDWDEFHEDALRKLAKEREDDERQN